MTIGFKGMHPDTDKAAYIAENATIENRVIVGMGAIVMNGAVIGEGSIIAAGALVKQGTVIPPYSLVAGMPGVAKKTLEPGQRPQEHNDEVCVADALAYAASIHHPIETRR